VAPVWESLPPAKPDQVLDVFTGPPIPGARPLIIEALKRRPAPKIDEREPVPALHALHDLFVRGVKHPLALTRWRVSGLSHYNSLHQAVVAGDLYAVVDRIQGGAELDERDAEGRTPLLVAAAENQPYVADFLLDRGAQLSEQDLLGNSVVHLAARASHIYTLENFLRRGAPLDARNLNGYTPLHAAAEAGDLFAVQHLVAQGANLFAMQDPGVLSIPAVLAARNGHWDITRFFRAKGQYFPIHMMAGQGDLPGVAEALADMPAAVNLFDSMQNTPLLSAIQTGECETAALLLEAGADPTLRNMEGDFPLAIALRRGHFGCATTLLERGANINEPLASGNELSLLGEALRSAPMETVSFIIEHGGDPRASWEGGRTALHVAVDVADDAKARLLVGAGADPIAVNEEGWSPLLLAAQRGLLPVMEAMTSQTDILDAQSPHGRRPIHEASAHGHADVVAWLLSKGVSPTSVDGDGRTALHRAALGGHTATVALLLDQGAPLEARDAQGNTAFLAAVEGGTRETVELLMDRGANGAHCNTNQTGAIHTALANYHVPLAYWLHARGIAVDRRDREGRSALFPAVRTGDRSVVEWLSTMNLPLDEKDSAGLSPIHEATAHGDIETIRFLIDKGVSLDAVDASLAAPVHLAAARGNLSILRLLLDSGVQSDSSNASGETPLHIAARNGHEGCVRFLAARGAVLDAKDHRGSTPLILAASAGHYHAAAALVRRGASIETVNSDGLTALEAASEVLHAPHAYPIREEKLQLRAYLHAVLLEEFRAAATWGDAERMKGLLNAYPAYCDAATFGRTPAHWAAQHGKTAILDLLRGHGADLLRLSDTAEGYAPIHFAAHYGHVNTANWLVENGTPADLKSAAGQTAHEVASVTTAKAPEATTP
jgi:ankyrin repeat protein